MDKQTNRKRPPMTPERMVAIITDYKAMSVKEVIKRHKISLQTLYKILDTKIDEIA